jgi:hypothetical protein
MRKVFFAAIATLTLAVGSLAFASAASAESSNGARPQVLTPALNFYNETGG